MSDRPTPFAANTSVSPEKTKAEIEALLIKYGATAFASVWEEGNAVIAFKMAGRSVRFIVPLPDPADRQFTHVKRGSFVQPRGAAGATAAYQQAVRTRWRAVLLVIKAKLEAAASGIVTFDDEFLAHLVLPDGSTVGETIKPQLAIAHQTGKMPPLLPYHAPNPPGER